MPPQTRIVMRLLIEPTASPPPIVGKRPGRRIQPTIPTLLSNQVSALSQRIENKILEHNRKKNQASLLAGIVIEDAMRLWTHWRDQTINISPVPDFSELFHKATNIPESRAGIKLDLKINPPLHKSFRWSVVCNTGGAVQYHAALEEALLLLLGLEQNWLQVIIGNIRQYLKKPLILFPHLRLERLYTSSVSSSASESSASSSPVSSP